MNSARNATLLCAVLLALCTVSNAKPATADVLKLKRVTVNEAGEYEVLFSMLDSERNAPSDVSAINVADVALAGGPDPASLTFLSPEGATIERLADSGLPFRVVVLLPNTDLFNGTVDSPDRPDASGLRGALSEALALVPAREDVGVYVGVFNVNLDWLPGATGATLDALRQALVDPQFVAEPGHFAEDPLRAIDLGFNGYCRQQRGNFATFLVAVTSAMAIHGVDPTSPDMQRLRGLLDDPEFGHVVALPVVYAPDFSIETLFDPQGDQFGFSNAITPERGTWRLTNTREGIQTVMRQVFEEVSSAFVLRFQSAGDVNRGRTYAFQLYLDQPDGTRMESNILMVRIPE